MKNFKGFNSNIYRTFIELFSGSIVRWANFAISYILFSKGTFIMRNKVIKTISILLVFVISLLALSSCGLINIGNFDNSTDGNGSDSGKGGMNGNYYPDYNFYPDGYTCGFPDLLYQRGPELEFWWVETYDECLAAIELLKSHGSTFAESAIFAYEGNLVDTKYCFIFSRTHIYTEKIKFGDNPFDRKACDVRIVTYAFIENVTIDEINYSDIMDYRVFSLRAHYEENMRVEENYLFSEWEFSNGKNLCRIFDGSKKIIVTIGNLCNNQENGDILSEEQVKVIFESLKWVDENGIRS